ncbi:MAG: heme biosynthesis HemY N-terminal domain-containing protein [Rhodospirillales bacterium]
MLRWIGLIILLAIAAVIAGTFAALPGEMTLEWGDYRIASSFAIFAVALVALMVLAAIAYRLWWTLRRASHSLLGGHRERRRRRGYEALSRGLVAVAAGDVETAGRQSKRAERLLDERPLTMLLSAQAAQMQGNDGAAASFFTAMRERPETEFLGLRGLLTQAMRRHDWPEALKLASRAYELNPKSEWVVSTLYDLRKQLGQWSEAEALLDRSVSTRLLSPGGAARERAELLYKKSLETAGADAQRWAQRAFKADPGYGPAAVRLARLYIADGRLKKAVETVERAWEKAPNPELADVYWTATESDDALKKVKAAHNLARFNPDHLESRLTIAVAALEARLWGEARSQLESVAAEDSAPRICRLMASLEEAEHGDTARARMWLMRAARDGDPEPTEEATPLPPAAIDNPVAPPLEPVAITADKARA